MRVVVIFSWTMRSNGALVVAQLLLLSVLAGRVASAYNVPGGEVEKNIYDPKYWRLAEDSLVKYEQENGFSVCHRVLRIMKVTEQIVAGTITRINFMGSITKHEYSTPATILCHSKIWEQPWTGLKDIKVKCDPLVY